jgi:cysteine synthase A
MRSELTADRARGIAETVLDVVGGTPLVRLNRVVPTGGARVLAKMESLNPGGSVKDRIAVAMVEEAERDGRLKPGATIVEPTSGNTGIGLAMVAAARGYRLILTMPEDMSLERRQLFARFGADLRLTPAIEGMTGAVFAAQELLRDNPAYFMPQQFENLSNPAVHERTTAREIMAQTGGEIDAFVAAIGTAGTITGVGRVLKRELDAVLVVGVEPARSPVLQGGRFHPHAIQGIGASFVPALLDRSVVDRLVTVEDREATTTAGRLAREEGLLVGISSGANVVAAGRIAAELGPGKTVVTVLCDTGERYLSVEL